MCVYITEANARSIEMGLDKEKAHKIYCDDLYELSLWMLSRTEQQWLAAARMFYENSEFYIQNFYKKVEVKNNDDFVFVGKNPSYHFSRHCEFLQANYVNYRIPVEIAVRGALEKERYRAWFKEHEYLCHESPERFITKMEASFLLKNRPHIGEMKASNSGVTSHDNVQLDDIRERISTRIEGMRIMRSQRPDLVKAYGLRSHVVRTGKLSLGQAAERDFVLAWDKEKSELKKELKEYFRIRFNPDLELQQTILQSIGFEPCKACGSI